MNETPQKKKMSTGCLVGIIAFSVLLLAVIALAFYCYSNREKLVRFGAVTAVQKFKEGVAKDVQPGVDTVQVNAVADQLTTEFKAADTEDMQKLATFMSSLQNVFNDEKIDSTEVAMFFRAAETYDPDLVLPEPPPVMMDTTGAALDTSGSE